MNTCIQDIQVRRQNFQAPAIVGFSQCIITRADAAFNVTVAHVFKIRLNICIAIQIDGAVVYASTASHSTVEGALNFDDVSR